MILMSRESGAGSWGTRTSYCYHLCEVSAHHEGMVYTALALWGLKVIVQLMLVVQQDDNSALCLI